MRELRKGNRKSKFSTNYITCFLLNFSNLQKTSSSSTFSSAYSFLVYPQSRRLISHPKGITKINTELDELEFPSQNKKEIEIFKNTTSFMSENSDDWSDQKKLEYKKYRKIEFQRNGEILFNIK